MGILYEKVLKMRENGRSQKPTVVLEKIKPSKKNESVVKTYKNRKETEGFKMKEKGADNSDSGAGGKP